MDTFFFGSEFALENRAEFTGANAMPAGSLFFLRPDFGQVFLNHPRTWQKVKYFCRRVD